MLYTSIDKLTISNQVYKFMCNLYPNLENAFLNLMHSSGHQAIKLEKKIDFNKLYNERFS